MPRLSHALGVIASAFLSVLAGDSVYAQAYPSSHVYVLRGGAHLLAGADELESELRANGAEVQVVSHWEWPKVRDGILTRSLNGSFHGPIVVVGYSTGGIRAVQIAGDLKPRGITIDLLVLSETVRPNLPIPSNVRRCLNIYRTFGMFGGRVEAESPATSVVNHNAKSSTTGLAFGRATHWTITGTAAFRSMLVSEVRAAEARNAPIVIVPTSTPPMPHAVVSSERLHPPTPVSATRPSTLVALQRMPAPPIDILEEDSAPIQIVRPKSTRSSMGDFSYIR